MKYILLFLIICQCVFSQDTKDISFRNFGAVKQGIYLSSHGDWYNGVTYELPDITKWLVSDVGYLKELEGKNKSFYIFAISIDLKNIIFDVKEYLNIKNSTPNWLSLEPGFWGGYDVKNESKHKWDYGLKVSLVDYKF